MNVAGFWDQEDPWGPWQIFRNAAMSDPERTNLIVAGPWFHGQWYSGKGDSIGMISFGGQETGREFRENFERPFFRYYLHGKGEKPSWQAATFQSGSNTWHTYPAWPPKEATPTKLFLLTDGKLSLLRRTQPAADFTASTFPIPPILYPIVSVPSRRHIPEATGKLGKLPTSALWTTAPMFCRTPANRSTTI